MRFIFARLISLLIFFGTAHATTIDFEEFPTTGFPVFTSQIESKGFVFEGWSETEGVFIANESIPIELLGSNSIGANPYSFDGLVSTALFFSSNELFSFNSFVAYSNENLVVTGTYDGPFEGCCELGAYTSGLTGIDLGQGLTQYFLTEEWINLTGVTIYRDSNEGNPMYIDNLTVNSAFIPIPAAFWLFGSALAGLGWIKRKQSS